MAATSSSSSAVEYCGGGCRTEVGPASSQCVECYTVYCSGCCDSLLTSSMKCPECDCVLYSYTPMGRRLLAERYKEHITSVLGRRLKDHKKSDDDEEKKRKIKVPYIYCSCPADPNRKAKDAYNCYKCRGHHIADYKLCKHHYVAHEYKASSILHRGTCMDCMHYVTRDINPWLTDKDGCGDNGLTDEYYYQRQKEYDEQPKIVTLEAKVEPVKRSIPVETVKDIALEIQERNRDTTNKRKVDDADDDVPATTKQPKKKKSKKRKNKKIPHVDCVHPLVTGMTDQYNCYICRGRRFHRWEDCIHDDIATIQRTTDEEGNDLVVASCEDCYSHIQSKVESWTVVARIGRHGLTDEHYHEMQKAHDENKKDSDDSKRTPNKRKGDDSVPVPKSKKAKAKEQPQPLVRVPCAGGEDCPGGTCNDCWDLEEKEDPRAKKKEPEKARCGDKDCTGGTCIGCRFAQEDGELKSKAKKKEPPAGCDRHPEYCASCAACFLGGINAKKKPVDTKRNWTKCGNQDCDINGCYSCSNANRRESLKLAIAGGYMHIFGEPIGEFRVV